jgi:hypothetical protein
MKGVAINGQGAGEGGKERGLVSLCVRASVAWGRSTAAMCYSNTAATIKRQQTSVAADSSGSRLAAHDFDRMSYDVW